MKYRMRRKDRKIIPDFNLKTPKEGREEVLGIGPLPTISSRDNHTSD